MAWTDERLDDLAARMDAGFTRVDGEIQGLRTEIGLLRSEMHNELRSLRFESRSLRTELKGDITELGTELKGDIGGLRTELKGDIGELRSMMLRFGVAMMVAMAGGIATLVAAIATGSLAA